MVMMWVGVGVERLSLPECEFSTEIADCVVFVAG